MRYKCNLWIDTHLARRYSKKQIQYFFHSYQNNSRILNNNNCHIHLQINNTSKSYVRYGNLTEQAGVPINSILDLVRRYMVFPCARRRLGSQIDNQSISLIIQGTA